VAQSSWRPGIPQGSILHLILFNTFINDLDEGAKSSLSKFADDTKLGRVADTPEPQAAIQRNLDSVEKRADSSLMKFSKCEVLHLRKNNARHKYRPGAAQLANCFAEKNLGVLVDMNLKHESEMCPATKKANGILDCTRQSIPSLLRVVILPLSSVLVEATPGVPRPVLGSSVQKR